MLTQPQVAALLIKVAVSASIASILMRFARMQKMLLRDERTVTDRLQLAFILAGIFGMTAVLRLLSHDKYPALDVAFEGSIISGMLGGYVMGLITGICSSLPDMMVSEHFMSMPLYAAAGLIGAVMHDLAPEQDDIWYFSPFIDLNLYRLLKQTVRLHRLNLNRHVIERAAFNVTCNAMVVIAELLRWGIHAIFARRNTFFLLDGTHPGMGALAASAATELFVVALPIRVWSSFRAERQLELERAQLIEARLIALTNQINPHFLFNTLNSLSALIRVDPVRARGVVYRLSNIMRRLLRKTESLSPLRDEISFLDDYLGIEMVRFGAKLRFEKKVEENTLDRLIPSMILQPIIENSIKHGLASKVEGGTVCLRTWVEGNRLHIVIEDDGVGIAPERLQTIYERGIGVSNVHERLRVLFGTRFRMQVDSEPHAGTRTHLDIPEMEAEQLDAVRRVSA